MAILNHQRGTKQKNRPVGFPGDVLDLLYDVVRKPPTAERAAGTHCLVTAALIKLVTRWGVGGWMVVDGG